MEEVVRNRTIAMQHFADQETNNSDFLNDDGDSNDECEEITSDYHDSSSEQGLSDLEEYNIEEKIDKAKNTDYFIGRGDNTKTTKRRKTDTKLEDIDYSLLWRKTPYTCKTKTKAKNIVNVSSGPTSFSQNITCELDAFSKMFDTEMITEIVICTNQRIERLQQTQSYDRVRDCRVTSETEILALFGVLYMIGIHHSNHVNTKQLWNSDGTGMQLFRAVMSYKRFLFLLRYLRFDDSSTRPDRLQTDKLAAIRNILDLFIDNCKKSYTMSECITIDEMLHPFRGRCSFVQYIPSKPAKYGLKIQALCDASTFFTGNFEVYCGQQKEGSYKVSNCPSEVAKRLVQPYENENRNLTTDKWYTSYSLAQDLLNKKITLLGSVSQNEPEIPIEFLPSKEKKVGTTVFGFQENTTLVSYVPRPNKAVILLSTMHDSPEIDPQTKKPTILLDYTATKGAVDTVNKMCTLYSVSRITRRWPLALFYILLNIAGINAQILFFSVKSENTRRIDFQKNLAMNLMKPFLSERAMLKSLPRDIQFFLQQYVPESTICSQTNSTVIPKRGRCASCKNSSTTIICNMCKNFVCKNHAVIDIKCEPCANPMSLLTLAKRKDVCKDSVV